MPDTVTLAILLTLAVVLSLISIKIGVSVAIIAIIIGIVVGIFFGISSSDHDWLIFLTGLGSVVLVFLAGAEIAPEAMKKTWKASPSIEIDLTHDAYLWKGDVGIWT
jgi:Kef-type K+ transport system membrane component KefB